MHVLTRLTLRALLGVSFALATATVPLFAAGAADAMAPSDKQLNQLYWRGQEALRQSDWNAAIKRFAELEQQMRAKEPRHADSAVYWQAYALLQARRTTEAKAMIERLRHDFPDSRWNKDAAALLRQAQPATAAMRAATSADGDEDLAETAVAGLMNAPPQRAVPLLKKVLASQHSDKVKKRALFVLSQIDQDAALDAVVDVARNSTDPELREEAIRMLGVSGEDRAIRRLSELYANSKDAREKRAIIQAWLVADRKDLILAAARTEAEAPVRDQAIEALGALDASAELKQLFDATKDADSQRRIIQALGVAGDVRSLSAIAAGNEPEPVRIEAIHALGVAGDEGGSKTLVALYPKVATPGLREAVMQGLLVAGDSDALLQLYRQARTKEEKQALLRIITATDSGAALDLIESELGAGQKTVPSSSASSSGNGTSARAEVDYERYAGAPIDGFPMQRLWQWQVAQHGMVVIWSAANQAYLLKVASPCTALEMRRDFALTQVARDKVSRDLDFVKSADQRCRITEIRPLDLTAMKAARRATPDSATED